MVFLHICQFYVTKDAQFPTPELSESLSEPPLLLKHHVKLPLSTLQRFLHCVSSIPSHDHDRFHPVAGTQSNGLEIAAPESYTPPKLFAVTQEYTP